MNVGIIGGGFTGLAAGHYLSKKGHKVTIFERDETCGGLAIGYHEKNWDWTLEQHYHHWFTNDKSILGLASEINHNVIIKRPKTSSFVNDSIYQLDSPLSLLSFPKLNIFNRIRMGVSLAFLRYNPIWRPLEKYHAESYLKFSMGKPAYEKIWKPLMKNKLGKYASDVALSWFWARVYKRTESLAYPEGGFLSFAQHLQNKIHDRGGKFYYSTEVTELSSNGKPTITFSTFKRGVTRSGGPPTGTRSEYAFARTSGGGAQRQDPEQKKFDAVIVTLPSFLFTKIAPKLPSSYKNKFSKLKGLGAINMVLRLKKQFLIDGTYWLNMCDDNSPILAIVEHTNFMDKKYYNNEHLVYLGNYLSSDDPRFAMSAEQLLKLYDPYLTKINPNYKLSVLSYKLFKAPFAQPIIPTNYSLLLPPFETPLKNVYLANIQQVYPWDRGTNYAVELGKKVAKLITS